MESASTVNTYVEIDFFSFLAYLEKKCLNLKQDADLEDTRRPFFCSLVLNLRVPLMLDPVGGASPRARSHVGLLINEHAAAGQGSVQFALLRVWYWNQHVVLQFLKHLQESKNLHNNTKAAESKVAWKQVDIVQTF